jgi:hypothetical protein
LGGGGGKGSRTGEMRGTRERGYTEGGTGGQGRKRY